MKYEEMSDFDLEVAVGNALGIDWFRSPSENPTEGWLYSEGKASNREVLPKYCSNPSDAWPIIVDNKISIWSQGCNSNLWCAHCNINDNLKYVSPSPLRAAMICFLKLKDAESE